MPSFFGSFGWQEYSLADAAFIRLPKLRSWERRQGRKADVREATALEMVLKFGGDVRVGRINRLQALAACCRFTHLDGASSGWSS
jgi:hypothetical protein